RLHDAIGPDFLSHFCKKLLLAAPASDLRPREIECDSLVTLQGRALKRTGCPPFSIQPEILVANVCGLHTCWWPTEIARAVLQNLFLLDGCAHPQPAA